MTSHAVDTGLPGDNISVRRLTTREKLLYSAGNFGNGITAGIIMFWMVYFFFPPADAGISYMIPQGSLFMGLTLIGVILAVNRLVDAVTDTWIANICNRSTNPKGKFIPMMRLAAPGALLFMVGIFFVPDPGGVSTANVLWITVMIALQALFQTMYSVPYYALQVKIAPHIDDKLDLNTIMGAFWFTGLVLASFSSVFWDAFMTSFGFDKIHAMQLTFGSMAVIGILTLLIPPMFLRESDYGEVDSSAVKPPRFAETAKIILNDKIYTRFLLIISLYYLATYMFESGMTYFLTVLAQMGESSVGMITSVTGVLSMLCYPIVNKLGKKKGKKVLLQQGFALFGLSLFIISFMGMFNIPTIIPVVALVILSPFPQAIMGIFPGAITADIAAYSQARTGHDNSSFYMAGNMFVNKLGATIAMLLFTSFLLLGKDIGDDFGVRVVAIFAMVICFFAYFIAKTYNEEEVLSYTRTQTPERNEKATVAVETLTEETV